MMAEGKVTIAQVYVTLLEVKDQLRFLNGTVRENCTDIAVLQEQQRGNQSSFGRLWQIAMPFIAAIAAVVISRVLP